MAEPSYYDILRVSEGASQEEIHQSFRRLAIDNHPDKNLDNKDQAETKFKELSEAYTILSDPDKRKKSHSQLTSVVATKPVTKAASGFIMCLLSTDEDCVVTKIDTCQRCLAAKLNARILHTYLTTAPTEWQKLKVRFINTQCVCGKKLHPILTNIKE